MIPPLVEHVRAKQAQLESLLVQVADLEVELNEAYRLLSPSTGRPQPVASPRALAEATAPAHGPEVDETTTERLVRVALMSGPFATGKESHALQTLRERCEDIPGLTGRTVERVLSSLVRRGLVAREQGLYRRAA